MATLTTTTGFAVDIIDNEEVSLLNLMHMPDVQADLVLKYPKMINNDLLWVENLGAMEEVATQETYFAHEEDLLFPENVYIASATTAALPANQIRITLATESHYSSGTKTSVRKLDSVMFDNGVQGIVIAKNETVNNAHTVLVQAINVSKGNIQTSAAVGSRLSIIANSDVEGGAGYDQSIMPQTTVISNQMQSFDELVNCTFEEMNNKTWVEFKNGDGGVARMYFTQAEARALQRMNAKRCRGMFLHEQNDEDSLLDGKLLKTTRGLIPDMEDRSVDLGYLAADFQLLDQIETIGKKTYQNGEWMILAQNNFTQELRTNGMTAFQGGGVVYGKDGAMNLATLGFNSYKYNVSDSIFHFKNLDILDDPSVTNQVGKKYVGMFLAMPASGVLSGGKITPRIKIKYKAQFGGGSKGNIKSWELGAYAKTATDRNKTYEIRHTSHEGLLSTGLDTCILGTNLSI